MQGYDPIALSERVEERVSRYRKGVLERRYWRIRSTRHYGGNVAGDVVGCNLRCAFCWAWKFSHYTDKGFYLSPQRAAEEIVKAGPYRIARLTGGEPTIAWEHTRMLAELLVRNNYLFVLETNGILIGAGRIDLKEIPRGVFIRVSIKAPTPEAFYRVTGARSDAWYYQIRALERLVEAGFTPGRDFRASVVLGVAPKREYAGLFEKLASIHSDLVTTIEPEEIILYPHVEELVKRRGLRLYHSRKPSKT